MKVEYKISSIIQTASEKTYIGQLNYVTLTDIPITENNVNEFPGLEVGETFQKIEREKIQEFAFRFKISKPDDEINNFLKDFGELYGEVINE